MLGSFGVVAQLVASQKGLSSMELVQLEIYGMTKRKMVQFDLEKDGSS
jgi:hypothetical protein